jgi:hypothetical protein
VAVQVQRRGRLSAGRCHRQLWGCRRL